MTDTTAIIMFSVKSSPTTSLADKHLGRPPGPANKRRVPNVNLYHIVNLVSAARPRRLDQVPSGGHRTRPVLEAEDVRGRDLPPRSVGGGAPERGEALWLQLLGQLGDRIVVQVLVEHALCVFWEYRDGVGLGTVSVRQTCV